MSEIFICGPSSIKQEITLHHCPNCGTEQKFLSEHYEWYGWSQTCLNCGDRWNDGEREPRPFMRGWRKEAIAKALERAVKLGLIEVEQEVRDGV